MATTGEKFVMVGLATALLGVATYDHVWHETRGADGKVSGVELIHEGDVSASNTTLNTAVLDPTNKTQVKQALINLAAQDPWCSSSYLAVKAEDVLAVDNADKPVIANSDAVVNVQVCLNPQTIDMRDGYLMAFFETNPSLQTGNGHPSLYLTYEQEVLVPQCKEAKEEMRTELQEDIVTVLGAAAAQNFQTEIHVDKDFMGHPCDDLFIEP